MVKSPGDNLGDFFRKYSMKKLSKLDLQNAVVSFGEPEEPDFDDESFDQVSLYLLPVKLDGIEYSTDELKFVIEEMKKDIDGSEVIIYRPDIEIQPQFRGYRLGYKIYKEFLVEYGNLMSIWMNRRNEVQIPKIYKRLGQEPGFTMEYRDGSYFVCTDEWRKENPGITNDMIFDNFNPEKIQKSGLNTTFFVIFNCELNLFIYADY